MTELVNTVTGEIVQVSVEEQTAVARLTTAIAALSDAVDFMPIADVVSIKAQVATIQTATKELGMSQEAQELAAEAVRRSEWTLGMAIRRGQADGSLLSEASKGGRRDVDHPDIARPVTDFAKRGELYGSQRATGLLDLADAAPEPEDFDAAIDAAKAEGNLSRANVTRKAREASGTPQRATRRTPLPDFARDAADDLLRVAERLERITNDDRFAENREAIAKRANGSLNRSLELLAGFRDALRNDEATS